MIEKTVYVADDGSTFESEEECLDYEAQTTYSDILQSITLFSENGAVIHFENDMLSFNEALDDAHFIFIPSYLTDNHVATFSDEVMSDLYGKYFPTSTGLYRWNWDNDEWISFTTETHQFVKKWNNMLDISINAERR